MGLYNRNYSPINTDFDFTTIHEVYFGETDEITKLFNQFCKIRDKYITSAKIKYSTKINLDPDLIIFNRMVEDIFGLNPFCLDIDPANDVNAFTLSLPFRTVGALTDKKEFKSKIISTKQGFKYKKDAKFGTIIVISSGLFLDANYNNREMFAIFLHEIGHNFEHSVSNTMYDLNLVSNLVSGISALINIMTHPSIGSILNTLSMCIVTNRPFMNKLIELQNFFHKDSVISKIFAYINVMAGVLGDVIGDLLWIPNHIAALTYLPSDLIRMLCPVLWPGQLTGYMSERLADNFATIYGFGDDLSTALVKLDNTGKAPMAIGMLQETPIIGHLINTILLPCNILTSCIDIHPRLNERINSQIDYLKAELDKESLDPKIVKELTSQINKIENSVEKVKDAVNSDKFNPFYVRLAYSAMLLSSSPNSLKKKILSGIMNPNKETDDIYADSLIK